MTDLDKARSLLATCPSCAGRWQQVLTQGGRLSPDEFAELNAHWHEAHGPRPQDSVMAGVGWNVREENTLRWCLAQVGVEIEALPAHGADGDHALPLGRERLHAEPLKHRIGED